MPVEGIGASLPASTQQSSLGQDDLFKILLTQLNYQDPLKPMDNQEFIAQLAQFTSLEQTQQMNQKLDQLLQSESIGQAISLLNQNIQVRLESAVAVGEVTAISFDNGAPKFTIKTADDRFIAEISLSQVEIIN